jgi:hypothetical protein
VWDHGWPTSRWTLGAAAAVGQVDGVTALALNADLLDSSLIHSEAGADEPRLRMLETIRAFATEQLQASGEAGPVRGRHAAYSSDHALQAGRQLWGPAQAEWLDRLHHEHDNSRSALAWLIAEDASEDVADVCFSLWMFWWIRGHLTEGQQWAERALACGNPPSQAGRAKLLFTRAFMRLPQGDYEQAATSLDEAARLARDAQEPEALCWTLTIRGYAVVRPKPVP